MSRREPSPPRRPVISGLRDGPDGNLVDDGDRGSILLNQLEHILESDTLINELGFVHPTQISELNAQSRASGLASFSNAMPTGGILNEHIPEQGGILYDETVFWYSDHKLAISITELSQLYGAVLKVFFNSIREYKASPDPDQFLQNDVLKHSKALLLLSCDFGSAWNSRKLVILRIPRLSLFMYELQLSALILSHSPKSESSWSHRRWVIKHIARICEDVPKIIGQESELVNKIAEKSKMNYRAWNHRCWLISYMTRSQVLDELNKSKKWAELHVADNCCFQFRRQLMLKMVEGNFVVHYGNAGFDIKSDMHMLWEDELKWNCSLIQHYIGREALWVHRRFLSKIWLMHFADDHHFFLACSENHHVDFDAAIFLQNELQLLLSCLNAPYDELEDGEIQSEHAISYFFWIIKVCRMFMIFHVKSSI
uniref:Protein prenyltransferase alpha subunit repeat-containing protein 1 n=1 Tax=Anthurium amnicola TaxID=1678845 RepID=A0A1D1YV52_9ARAE